MVLHLFQEKILQECLTKKSGAISVPMGSGKTLISLSLANHYNVNGKHLIVVAKTLLYSWEIEIKKWFPNVKYKILNLTEDFKSENNTTFFITTPSTLIKYYKLYNIKDLFIKGVRGSKNNKNYNFDFNTRTFNEFGAMINHYNSPLEPFIKEKTGFYSINFDSIIIDEAHNYLNIKSLRCQAICSIYAKHRWLLSGTLFSCVKEELVLGFHKMIDCKNFPDNLPDTRELIRNINFKGIRQYIIYRDTNEMFTDIPDISKQIISYDMEPIEKKIYTILKNTIYNIYNDLLKENSNIKVLNSQLLVMITIIRLFIITPYIPVFKIFSKKNPTELDKILKLSFEKNDVLKYLNTTKCSTRIVKTIDILNKYKTERVIIMSSFRIVIDYLLPYLPNNRNYYTIKSTHSSLMRSEIINAFSKDHTGVLLMTYTIGSEGLNLQFASKMILMDVWWDSTKSRQSVARIMRYGQKSNVNVYLFYSNTYIEKVMFKKHKDKNDMISELIDGQVTSKVEKIKLKNMIELIIHEESDIKCAKLSM